jgi:hypothetical protein
MATEIITELMLTTDNRPPSKGKVKITAAESRIIIDCKISVIMLFPKTVFSAFPFLYHILYSSGVSLLLSSFFFLFSIF